MLSEILAGGFVTILGLLLCAVGLLGAFGGSFGPGNRASPLWAIPGLAGVAILVWYFGFYTG